MEQKEMKELIDAKVAELNQRVMQRSQEMKEELVAKLGYAEEFMAKLNTSKEVIESQIKQSKALLDDLAMPLDLSQKLADFEQSMEQEGADLEKLATEFQQVLAEIESVQLNDRKAKVLFVKEEMEAKLISAQETLGGKSSQTKVYTQKVVSLLKDKWGEQWKKMRLVLAEHLEGCAVKLKA